MLPKPFKKWTTYDGHAGVDFPQAEGTHIPASAKGRVVFVGWNMHKPVGDIVSPGKSAGNTRIVDYGNGVRVRYCHLENLSGPRYGDVVNLGDSVGVVGETGLATGPHLHMEVWVNGVIQKGANFWKYVNKNQTVKAPAPAGGGSKPLEEEVIQIIEREIARKTPQVLTNGKKAYLRLNDAPESHVTVARGAQQILGGSITIVGAHSGDGSFVGGFPPVIQLEAVAETIDTAGKVKSSRTLGKTREAVITAGNTYADFAVPAVTLRAGESLRFKVVVHDVEKFTIGRSSINISTALPPKA